MKLPASDNRKMDDELFWELIDSSNNSSDSFSVQLADIVELLGNFKAKTIRRFQRILEQKINDSYHWDLLALAYIAQDGCSDDAFESFQTWLILQGREVYSLAMKDIRQVMHKIPAGSGTQGSGLLSVASIAFENRAGKPLSPISSNRKKLKGEPWLEEELELRFPEICQ